ncbi:hypothetical protein HK105_204173 [Polyrhizophydium stewartii]|uniref:C2H2-type domain-containing protein n=1 Tax=Polyrhizophydium stewartii TaxID=2732419 RepID=A0ABR4NA62_9FUNG
MQTFSPQPQHARMQLQQHHAAQLHHHHQLQQQHFQHMQHIQQQQQQQQLQHHDQHAAGPQQPLGLGLNMNMPGLGLTLQHPLGAADPRANPSPHAAQLQPPGPAGHVATAAAGGAGGGPRLALRNQQALEALRVFLATAPTGWPPGQKIKTFHLPNKEVISCVLYNDLFHITGTDIVRALTFRFECFGREIVTLKKFEEGVFSDLRALKPGVDATLEEPRSEFLKFLHEHGTVRTQKKQKVFYWFSVDHDRLFVDALERDLKRERAKQEPCTASAVPMDPQTSLRLALEHVATSPFNPGGPHSMALASRGAAALAVANRTVHMQLPLRAVTPGMTPVMTPNLTPVMTPSMPPSTLAPALMPLAHGHLGMAHAFAGSMPIMGSPHLRAVGGLQMHMQQSPMQYSPHMQHHSPHLQYHSPNMQHRSPQMHNYTAASALVSGVTAFGMLSPAQAVRAGNAIPSLSPNDVKVDSDNHTSPELATPSPPFGDVEIAPDAQRFNTTAFVATISPFDQGTDDSTFIKVPDDSRSESHSNLAAAAALAAGSASAAGTPILTEPMAHLPDPAAGPESTFEVVPREMLAPAQPVTPPARPTSAEPRNYTCPVATCGRQFRRSDQLRRHARSHSSPASANRNQAPTSAHSEPDTADLTLEPVPRAGAGTNASGKSPLASSFKSGTGPQTSPKAATAASAASGIAAAQQEQQAQLGLSADTGMAANALPGSSGSTASPMERNLHQKHSAGNQKTSDHAPGAQQDTHRRSVEKLAAHVQQTPGMRTPLAMGKALSGVDMMIANQTPTTLATTSSILHEPENPSMGLSGNLLGLEPNELLHPFESDGSGMREPATFF